MTDPAADPGPRLAAGRSSIVFDLGDGVVLRRSRHDQDCSGEAAVMVHAHAAGVPVPEVLRAEGRDLVMRRVEGPTMLDDLTRRPWRLRRHAATLAELGRRIHAVDAPADLHRAPMAGDRLLHLDLHPANVICSPDGPVVIDWENAAAGDPAFDLAVTWMLLAVAEADVSGGERVAVAALRQAFVRAWLARVGRAAAARGLRAAAEQRAVDPNTTPGEVERARALADRHGSG